MKTNCNYIIVVKFLVIFLIFVSSKTILASYDTFEEYDEEQMEPAPMPSPDESSQYEVFDVSMFGATDANSVDNTLVSLLTSYSIYYLQQFILHTFFSFFLITKLIYSYFKTQKWLHNENMVYVIFL